MCDIVDFQVHLEDLQTREKALDVGFDTAELASVCVALRESADRLKEKQGARLSGLNANTSKEVNRRLIGLERAWLHEDGLQERPWSRSLFGAEDPVGGYAPWMLPGLRWEIEQQNGDGLADWVGVYAQAVTRLAAQMDIISDVLE